MGASYFLWGDPLPLGKLLRWLCGLLACWLLAYAGLFVFFALSEQKAAAYSSLYRARTELGVLSDAVLQFRQQHGRLPLQLAELNAQFQDRLPIDPWGRSYVYEPQPSGHFRLYTLGADASKGGTGSCTDFYLHTDINRVIHQVDQDDCLSLLG